MLNLISSVSDNFRRDIPVADETYLNPTEAEAYDQGEWLVRDSSGNLERVGADSVSDAMQIWTQKGDTAAQAISKIAVIQLHEYEAETDMFEDGGAGFAPGTKLTVKTLSDVDGEDFRTGLTQAAAGEYVYGVVITDPDDNGGLIKYRRSPAYLWVS